MGVLVSRWWTKPTTVEVLEGLDKDIHTLEKHRENTQKRLKFWIYRLLLYSTLLYLLACVIVYFWYIPQQLMGKIIVASPFLIFPPLIWLLRKLLITLCSRRTERNDRKLEELKAAKKRILEQVMETEIYKNAKQILERFDPDSIKQNKQEAMPVRPHMTPRQGHELRQRQVTCCTPIAVTPNTAVAARLPPAPAAPPALISAPGGPPERILSASGQHHNLLRRNATPGFGMGIHPPGPPLARPILPRERGALDKVIEYLVGDGPENRYALICQQCLSHNGMALKEEYEYIAFRCAYCYFLNPARKTRPQAPQLPEPGESKMSTRPSPVAVETGQGALVSPSGCSAEEKPEAIGLKEEEEPQMQLAAESPLEVKKQGVLESDATVANVSEKSDTTVANVSEKSDTEEDVSSMEVE